MMTHREQPRRPTRHDPDLVLAYLQYALDDVREFSERSGRQLELAINALAEDTRVIKIEHPAADVRRS